jgi:hypothetical protein
MTMRFRITSPPFAHSLTAAARAAIGAGAERDAGNYVFRPAYNYVVVKMCRSGRCRFGPGMSETSGSTIGCLDTTIQTATSWSSRQPTPGPSGDGCGFSAADFGGETDAARRRAMRPWGRAART